MACFLDKNKIKEGIIESVKDKISQNHLLKIDGNTVTVTKTEKLPLTDQQRDLIEKAATLGEDLKGAYKDSFLTDHETFLREIAEQANSSQMEERGALSVAGPELFDIAITAFPEEGLLTEENKAVTAINAEYGIPVLQKAGTNTYTLDIPNKLVVKYLAMQEGSKEQIMDELRQTYLSQYSSHSLNMMDENL